MQFCDPIAAGRLVLLSKSYVTPEQKQDLHPFVEIIVAKWQRKCCTLFLGSLQCSIDTRLIALVLFCLNNPGQFVEQFCGEILWPATSGGADAHQNTSDLSMPVRRPMDNHQRMVSRAGADDFPTAPRSIIVQQAFENMREGVDGLHEMATPIIQCFP
jgi:hypothetical protein